MKILVTGSRGFLGTHLICKLRKDGHEVIAFTRNEGDLCDSDALNSYSGIDYVYHLAARTYVPDSWKESHKFFRENIMTTATVLEFCRNNGCAVSLMSTYVYGEPRYLPIDENHPVCAMSPYHETKLICESMGSFYSRTFSLPVTVFRPFNIYGKGQSNSFLIPKILRQLMDKDVKEIAVMDLAPKRDYVYIDDVIEILAQACVQNPSGFEVYNIGSGVSNSVRDVISTAIEVTGICKPYFETGEIRVGEISDSVADMKKTITRFNVDSLRSLEQGLTDWMLKEFPDVVTTHNDNKCLLTEI